jgi:hypothetical protein
MIYHTQDEHANHYTTDEPTIYHTQDEHANHYTTDEPTMCGRSWVSMFTLSVVDHGLACSP